MDSNLLTQIGLSEVQSKIYLYLIEHGQSTPSQIATGIDENRTTVYSALDKLEKLSIIAQKNKGKISAFIPKHPSILESIAEKRLRAIRDYAAFGSGIKIAMRDLEIRGVGNLLGAEQSGHMVDVGYDMYMKLLSEAVLEAKGLPAPQRAECSADLAVAAAIPDRYVPSSEQRMDLYRRIALIRTEEEADDLTDELIDRFGDPPPSVNSLIHIALLRGEAGQAGVTDISQKQGMIRFTLRDFDMEKVSALYAREEYRGRLRVEAGSKPRLSLKIRAKNRVLDEARAFVRDWAGAKGE